MKKKDFFSFLVNRGTKAKIIFLIIVAISSSIVLLDAFSIFSLLSIVSFVTETGNLQDKFSNLNFLPEILLNFTKNLSFKEILLILILILFLRNIINIFYQFLIFKFIKFLELDTNKKIFFVLIKKKYLNFYNETSNELIKNFQTSINQYLMHAESVARITSDFIILILYFILLSYLSFKETLFIFIYFFLIFLCLRKILSNFSFKFGKIHNKSASNINLAILNTFKNFSQIIIRNLKKKYLDFFSEIVVKYSHSRLIINFIKSINRQFLEVSILLFILIVFYLLNKIYSINDVLALTTVYIAAAYRLMPSINSLIASYIKIKNYEYGFKIIDNQINFFNKKYKNIYFSRLKTKNNHFQNNIIFKDINFKFENSKLHIFKGLNLKIKKNNMIGIIGGSGSGKTTLAKILIGLIAPDSGKIFIDGKKIDKSKIQNYYSLYSYLPQENLFIPGTIRENIAFGEDNIDEEKVIKVLRETNCMEFVKKLKNKINHEIKESGSNFSAGQLQRFALARALYFDNEILILDEPTSALDKQAEDKFLKLIKNLKKNKTIIIISHKISTLKNCNKIYKMNKKKLNVV